MPYSPILGSDSGKDALKNKVNPMFEELYNAVENTREQNEDLSNQLNGIKFYFQDGILYASDET